MDDALDDATPVEPGAYPIQTQALLAWQALDKSDDIILLIEDRQSADPAIIGANGACLRATGRTEYPLINRLVRAPFPEAAEADRIAAAIRTRGVLRGEFTCARARGESFTVGMHLMPAPTAETGRACSAILGPDITQVKAEERPRCKAFSPRSSSASTKPSRSSMRRDASCSPNPISPACSVTASRI